MSTKWDPTQYAKFAYERNRPFHELIARVRVENPATVVDLGCGNGPLTLELAARWPLARVVGVDSSPQMIEAARALDVEHRVEWVEADARTWDLGSLGVAADVLVSNATLQWIPNHLALVEAWAAQVAPGGALALQVPGNFDAPTHRLMREVARTHPRVGELEAALKRGGSAGPSTYLKVLARAGLAVDAWETTYLHILDPEAAQDNPVLEWVTGTGLRPILDTLAEGSERDRFLTPYAAALREAYPRTVAGVILPFRRVFAVGHRA